VSGRARKRTTQLSFGLRPTQGEKNEESNTPRIVDYVLRKSSGGSRRDDFVSLGLGSVAMSRWLQSHKPTFFSVALVMMALSLLSAIREKKKTGKNTGLFAFSSRERGRAD
jgi:hypothetical protein